MTDKPLLKTYTCKLVVLGHYSVGKSSMALNFVKGEFNPNEESTIGASFLTKSLTSGDYIVKYEIWDTAGQERYYSLIPMYYRGAQVALIMYDVTSNESFETAKKWVEELKYDKPNEFIKILVANKIDLQDEMVITREMALEFAEKERLLFYETSAKTGEGISKLFKELTDLMPKQKNKNKDKIKLKLKKHTEKFFCC